VFTNISEDLNQIYCGRSLDMNPNLMGAVNENGTVEKISAEESKVRIMKSKSSKDDLQPYVGSDLCMRLSQNLNKWAFSLSHIPY
jgi:hypothetical protein